MNSLDKIELLRDLDGTTLCELVHGKGYKDEDIIAIDYLTIPLGMVKIGQATDYLTIPVCSYCIESLSDPEWVLIVCKDCGRTRWIWKKYSRLEYIHKETNETYGLILTEGCPGCSGKLEGIYYYHYDQFKGVYEVN